jgi:hypothetical protein
MSHRTLLISAVLTVGASLAGVGRADIIAVDSGIAVKESGGAAPARGMTMSQVSSKFGAPSTKVAAVGNPPISRWEYPGFVVYFERDYVIHSVISESGTVGAGAAAPAPGLRSDAPAPDAPAESSAPAPPPSPGPSEPPQTPTAAPTPPQASESAPPAADPAAAEPPPAP